MDERDRLQALVLRDDLTLLRREDILGMIDDLDFVCLSLEIFVIDIALIEIAITPFRFAHRPALVRDDQLIRAVGVFDQERGDDGIFIALDLLTRPRLDDLEITAEAVIHAPTARGSQGKRVLFLQKRRYVIFLILHARMIRCPTGCQRPADDLSVYSCDINTERACKKRCLFHLLFHAERAEKVRCGFVFRKRGHDPICKIDAIHNILPDMIYSL